jgi:hypothetical protein
MEEQARVAAEEARRRLEEERLEREEVERREHERRLAEIRVRQETEGRARLAEEELRLKHERELAVLEASRRRTPTWVWVTITGLVLLAAAGTVPYLAYRNADAALAAEQAARRDDRAASEQRLQGLRQSQAATDAERRQLQTDVRDANQRIVALQDRLDRAEPVLARVPALEDENRALKIRVEELNATCGKRPPRPPTPTPPTDTAPPAIHRECVNVGTPLEVCFDCPGDPQCG